MGPIQSGINQSLAILSLASSQSPQLQTNRKASADTKAFNKFIKTEQETPFGLGEESEKMFKELQQEAIKSNLKANKTKDVAKISAVKPETEKIKDDIRELAKQFNLNEDSTEKFVKSAYEGIKKIEMNYSKSSKAVRKNLNDAIDVVKKDKDFSYIKSMQNLQNKISNKKTFKTNMDMMRNALKEDN